MPDLTTRYLGFELRTPVVASASPMTADPTSLGRLEEAGVGAVVLPSLFEEQLVHEAADLDAMLDHNAEAFAEATSFFPDLQDYNTGPDQYLQTIAEAKRRLTAPVIASLNGTSTGGWVRYAREIEDAGADALELNVYLIAADFSLTPAEVEGRYVDLVESVRSAVDLPLAVKIGPQLTSVPVMAQQLVRAGADGLVLFNRFYQPDIDPDTREIQPNLVLSTSDELRLPLRWIAICSGRVDASLALTSGVHEVEDVAKGLLAGADVTMATSALLRRGASHVRHLTEGLHAWMVEHEYDSVEQLKGSVSQRHAPDPEAFARANYLQTLSSWSSPFPA